MRYPQLFCSLICLYASSEVSAGQFYLETEAGYGGINTPSLIPIPANTQDVATQAVSNASSNLNNKNNYGFTWRGSFGYLWNNAQMRYGFETGYSGYPNNAYSSLATANNIAVIDQRINYQSYLIDILGVGKYYWSSNWNLFAKGGLAIVNQTLTENLNGASNAKRSIAELPEVVLGLGYDINQHVSLDWSLRYAFGANPNLTTVSVKNYQIGNNPTVPSVLVLLANTHVPSIFSTMLGVRYNF